VAWSPGLTSLVKIELATVVVRFALQQSPTEQSDGRVNPPVLSKARSAHCAAQPPLRELVTVTPRAREQPQLMLCARLHCASEVGCNRKALCWSQKGTKSLLHVRGKIMQCLATSGCLRRRA